MGYIYRHIREDLNRPFYIGVSVTDGKNQGYQRSASRKERNKYWHHIAAKTKWYAEIMMDGLTKEEAFQKEKEFIKLYGRVEFGGILVNMTDGGEGSWNVSMEAKMKISAANKGNPPPNKGKKMAEHLVEQMRLRMKGMMPPNVGIPHKEETKRKMRERKKAHHKPLLQFLGDKLIAEFAHTRIAAEQTGINAAAIAKCVTGVNRTSGGFTWRYKNPQV